ncbi:MAG: TonB-dependent receptor [Campylobacterales bacterium]
MYRYLILIVTLFGWADEIDSLQKTLEESSYVATMQRRNVDYQPYTMNVYRGDELVRMGLRTLEDALMLAPGVDIAFDSINYKTPIFRGSNPVAYGQSKLIIDGVTVNDRTFNGYSPYLHLPVELIERIEIVRGVGYGWDDQGYAGTIRVITKSASGSTPGSVWVGAGSFSAYSGGVLASIPLQKGRISFDFFGDRDDLRLQTLSADGLRFDSNSSNRALAASGRANLSSKIYSTSLQVIYDEFRLIGRYTGFKSGDAFGNLNALPNEDAYQKMPTWYVEGSWRHNDHQLRHDAKIGYMKDSWASMVRSLPVGYATSKGVLPIGYWVDLKTTNSLLYFSWRTTYSGLDNHFVTVGLYHGIERNEEVKTYKNLGVGWFHDTQTPFFIGDRINRDQTRLYLQERWNIDDQAALEASLGLDYEQQTGVEPTARLGYIWQHSVRQMSKVIVGTNYRLPAAQELAVVGASRVGNPDLDVERMYSLEIQHIYHFNQRAKVALTLYGIEANHQINRLNSERKYQNNGESTTYGLEAEGTFSPIGRDTLLLNYSWLHLTSSFGDNAFVSEHLVKMAYTTPLVRGWFVGTRGVYVGPKERIAGDLRNPTKEYATLDLSLGWSDKEWMIRGGVMNLTDEDIASPSEPNTYDDYPVVGRTWFVRIGRKF